MTASRVQHRQLKSRTKPPAPVKGRVRNHEERVSVIITCHNYGRFLAESVESVLAQTHDPYEILIVDDASTDDTTDVASRYLSSRVFYLQVNHRSCYLSRRSGLARAGGDFVVFLDADDKLEPSYFDECLDAFAIDPGAAICTTDIQNFGAQTNAWRMVTDDINRQNSIHCASMVKRSALLQSNAFQREELSVEVCEDWWVWRWVMNSGFRAIRVPKPLFLYRKHGASRSDVLFEKRQTFYDWSGLKYETVSKLSDGRSEYLIAENREYVTEEIVQSIFKQFAFDVAGVSEGGCTIIRRSVLRQLPTDDPLSDRWKVRIAKAGFRWIPEFVPTNPPPIEAVLITPLLTVGGAEQWIRMLVTLCDSASIHWRIVLLNGDAVHPSIVDPIAANADMFIAGRGYSDRHSAVKAAAEGADIVVTWGGQQLWPLDLGIPIVMVAHTSCDFSARLMRAASEGGATHFACVSELSKRLTTTPEMQATVIGNGADLSRLVVTQGRKEVHTLSWGVADDWWYDKLIYVGNVSRLANEKNPMSLVNAVAELPWQFQCVWIGGGPIKDSIVARAGKMLETRFHHVDNVDDVGNHYNALDVVVATSHFEGNSLTLIEAMLSGVPIVTTRVGAVEELERAAGTPLFVSLPDFPTSHEIAVAIRAAVSDGRSSERVILAQKFAQEFLTGQRMANDWTTYLAEIAANWNRRVAQNA